MLRHATGWIAGLLVVAALIVFVGFIVLSVRGG